MILAEYQVTVGWNGSGDNLAWTGWGPIWPGLGGISPESPTLSGYPVTGIQQYHASGVPFTPYLDLSLDTNEHAEEVLNALAAEGVLRIFTDAENFLDFFFADAYVAEGFNGPTETIRWNLTGDYAGLTNFWIPSAGEARTVQVLVPDPEPVRHIAKWEGASDQALAPWTWRSKEFVNRIPTSIGAVKVDAVDYPVTIELYCDDELYDTIEVSNNEIHRVSVEKGLGRKWVVVVKGIGEVDAVYAATTVDELVQYLSG